VVGDERLERFAHVGRAAAIAHHGDALHHQIHQRHALLGTPFELHSHWFEDQVGQQHAVEGRHQRDREAAADQVHIAATEHEHQVDQSDQRADHAERRRIVGHRPEQLCLGILPGAQSCDAPLQKFQDVFFRGVVDHQLHAGAQKGIADLLDRFFHCR